MRSPFGQQYGGADQFHWMRSYDTMDFQKLQQASAGFLGRRLQKTRVNVVAALVAHFVPWLLFCTVCAALSFDMHYTAPMLSFTVVLFGAGVVFLFLCLSATQLRNKWAGSDPQPSWYIFLLISCSIALWLGVVLGNHNFSRNSRPFYDITHLGRYTDVDPATMSGQQLMDGGRVSFAKGSALDLKLAMSFKNEDTYCVAPITRGDLPLATYDFWAVGVNCCSGDGADFACGDFVNQPSGHGLRLVRDEWRPFMRLAVQQAESSHMIKAEHPLFFQWVEDADASFEAKKKQSLRFYAYVMMGYFAFQALTVLTATVLFATSDVSV